MPLLPFIKKRFQDAAYRFIESRPQPTPSLSRLRRCKIISHRGDHRNRPEEENTISAFDRSAKMGVWGIELDIRFSADGEPMVFHDADLSRVYGSSQSLAALTRHQIKDRFPDIPMLEEVVRRFGRKRHLMIEVKEQPWPRLSIQNARLRDILSSMTPVEDFHLLCLHPRALMPVKGFPSCAKVAISEYWPELRRKWIRRRSWGGLCGHYLLLGRSAIDALHRNGQKAGSGYVRSQNGLFREINRGVDWIFSNHAVQLQQRVNACLPEGLQRE